MPKIKEIRAAIKDTLAANLPGVNVKARVSGHVVVPAIVVTPVNGDFEQTMVNGATAYNFYLDIAVPSGGDDEIGQDNLDDYLDAEGDRSIKAIIMNNPHLGRPDVNAHVRGWSEYGARFEWAADRHVGARLRLFVIAKNS